MDNRPVTMGEQLLLWLFLVGAGFIGGFISCIAFIGSQAGS